MGLRVRGLGAPHTTPRLSGRRAELQREGDGGLQLLHDAPVQARRRRQLRHASRGHVGSQRARLLVQPQPGEFPIQN